MLTPYTCARTRVVYDGLKYNLADTVVFEAGVRLQESSIRAEALMGEIREMIYRAIAPSLLRNADLKTLAHTARTALEHAFPATKLWVIVKRAGDSVCAGVS